MNENDVRERVLAAARRTDPAAEAGEARRLTGGASGLTYAMELRGTMNPAGGNVVVKVAPPGLAPVKNRDVLRQARLMDALAGHPAVRVPSILLRDEGAPVEVPPLYVMSFVDGVCFEPIGDPVDVPLAPDEVRARQLDTARQLAALHSVDPAAVGLGEEPVVSLSDELARWERVIATVDEDLRPRAEEIGAALRERLPAAMAPVITHGDYRLGNTLAADGRVNAVVDWEIWAVGDPRVDLSWFLMHTEAARLPTSLQDADGNPSEEELLAEYVAARGLAEAPDDLGWFHAFTQFKGAAIVGQIVKHNRRRDTPDARVVSWDPHVPPTFLANAEKHLAALG